MIYFPSDSNAKSRLLLCNYANELGIECDNAYYPRVEYNCCVINSQIKACKKFQLTNSATRHIQNGVDTIIVWHEPCGKLAFVDDEFYDDVDEEWSEFIGILKSYNPIDYDDINNNYIYDIDNGKHLISDYDMIICKLKEKISKKIESVKLKNKIAEFERLKKELEQ